MPEIIWEPNPGPQSSFIECPVFEVFFGGARGGGKTEAQIGDWLAHSAKYGENAIGIFVRRKLTQLSEVIARTKYLFSKIGARYREQQKEWIMANGARLKFVYLEKDSDAEEYQGHSYTRVYIEELTNFPSPDPVNKLRATLRSGAGVPVGFRATGNPGGAGHNWVKARYIDPAPPYSVIKETEVINGVEVSLSRVFIPSKISDNPKLMENDPTYLLRVKQSGSEALVKAWLDGDWSIIDGAYFDCFNPAVHVRGDLLPPAGGVHFQAFDWGSASPFSYGLYAVSDGTWGIPSGALYRYSEWYGASGPNKGLRMTVDSVAEGILARTRGVRLRYGVADPSIFTQDGGPSLAEQFLKKGVRFWRADNRRIPGWQLIRNLLTVDPPMLYFSDSCDDFLRTFPTLQHDPRRAEDLDTDGEDHAADELRYAVMSRYKPLSKEVPPEKASFRPVTFNDLLKSSIKARAKA